MQALLLFVLTLLISTHSLAAPPGAVDEYQQPHPHSSGADLLYHCEKTDLVVDQLRCDYYIQGVADLATIPQRGVPMACIPQGQSRTQLIKVVLKFLQETNANSLEQNSAASLILKAFNKTFPCPKSLSARPKGKAGGLSGASPELRAVIKQCAAAGGDQATIQECIQAGDRKLKAAKKSGWDKVSPELAAILQQCSEVGGDQETIKQCVIDARGKSKTDDAKQD